MERSEVKITVLNDNRPGRKLLAEHGLSYLVEADGKRILLDTGASDVFLKNAAALGIDLEHLDAVVLSHGHWDHGDGLKHLKGLPLIAHPDCFKKRYHKNRNRHYVGLALNKAQVQQRFSVQLSRKPVWISEKIVFLGEIPKTNNFEAQNTAFEDENGADDFIPDDSGLAIQTARGLVVLSGCAHAGICNTLAHAQNLTGENKIWAVMGGFHLKKSDALTTNTVYYIKQLHIGHVIPTHCTELPALARFFDAFGSTQVATGDCVEL